MNRIMFMAGLFFFGVAFWCGGKALDRAAEREKKKPRSARTGA